MVRHYLSHPLDLGCVRAQRVTALGRLLDQPVGIWLKTDLARGGCPDSRDYG